MKRRTVLMICVLSVVVSVWVGDGSAAGQAKDAVEKIPGKKFLLVNHYQTGYCQSVTKMDAIQDIQIGGRANQKITMQQVMTLGMEISKPDKDGNRSIVMRYERITMKSVDAAGNVLMSYDSDLPAEKQNGMAVMMFAPMLKMEFKMTVDKKGDVVKVQGITAMLDKIVEENPQLAATVEGLRKSLNDEAIADMVSQNSKYLPEIPVGIGDTWKIDNSMAVPMIGKTKTDMNMKMVAVDKTPAGRIAKIDISGTMAGEGSDNPMFKKFDMTLNGHELYNLDTQTADKVVINATIKMQGGGQKGFVIDMNMKMETTLKYFDKKPVKKSVNKKPTTTPAES